MLQMLQLAVIMAVAVTCITAKKQCRWVNTEEPRTDHRCVTASERYMTIQNVPSHLCFHICMELNNCTIINYNHEKRYCNLTSEDCQKTVEDSEFTVTILSCLHWVSFENTVEDMCIPCDIYTASVVVGRLLFQKDILVGKHSMSERKTYVWKNGTTFAAANTEVLQIMPWCAANWMTFVPGDPIPAGAVVGGYVGDPFVETYVITGVTRRGVKRCGYYNPETGLGYVVGSRGAEATTEMDILVLHWLSNRIDHIQLHNIYVLSTKLYGQHNQTNNPQKDEHQPISRKQKTLWIFLHLVTGCSKPKFILFNLWSTSVFTLWSIHWILPNPSLWKLRILIVIPSLMIDDLYLKLIRQEYDWPYVNFAC